MPTEPSHKPTASEHPPRWRVEGAPEPKPPGRRRWPMGLRGRIWIWVVALLAINLLVSTQVSTKPSRLAISFTFFQQQVKEGNVEDIVSTGNTIEGDFKKKTAPPAGTA